MEQDYDIKDVLLAQRGNKDAFVGLIEKMKPTLYRVSKSILHRDEECVDATQEAILIAYSSLHTLKEPKYFKTWFVRILINECYRLAKQTNKILPFGDIIEQSSLYATTNESNLELQEAILSLDKDLKIVITLYYLEDISLKTIAQTLEVPEGTIKSRLSRARQKLAEMLSPIQEKRGVGYE